MYSTIDNFPQRRVIIEVKDRYGVWYRLAWRTADFPPPMTFQRYQRWGQLYALPLESELRSLAQTVLKSQFVQTQDPSQTRLAALEKAGLGERLRFRGGQTPPTMLRCRVYQQAKDQNLALADIIHPAAVRVSVWKAVLDMRRHEISFVRLTNFVIAEQ